MWRDKDKPPYTALFNEGLTAVRMWNSVQVMREVEFLLNAEGSKRSKATQTDLIAVHGNRFVLHHVFKNLDRKVLEDPQFELEHHRDMIHSLTVSILRITDKLIEDLPGRVYLQTLFKNYQKCKELSARIPVPTDYDPKFKYNASRQVSLFDLDRRLDA